MCYAHNVDFNAFKLYQILHTYFRELCDDQRIIVKRNNVELN